MAFSFYGTMQILKQLHQWFGNGLDERVRAYLMRGSMQSLFLQMMLMALTLFTSFAIAWGIGDAGAGVYSVVSNWAFLLGMAALFGLDDVLIKQIPIYQNKPHFTQMLVRWAFGMSLLTNALVLLVCVGWLCYASFDNETLWQTYWAALGVIPLFVWLKMQQAVLLGHEQVGKAQVGEKFIQPLVFIVLLGGGWYCLPMLTTQHAILCRLISFGAAVLGMWWVGRQFFNLKSVAAHQFQLEADTKRRWQSAAFYFMLISLLYAVNTRIDVAMLDIYHVAPEQIAYYNAAARFADIVTLPFSIVATIALPIFSKYYHQRQLLDLQRVYSKLTRIAFILTAIGVLGYAALGNWLLSWYSPNFKLGYASLLILSSSKLIHTFFGAMSGLLMMAGFERQATISLIITTLITLILHTVLIPLYQIEGAAWAGLLGGLCMELMQMIIVWRKVGIVPMPFGKSHL